MFVAILAIVGVLGFFLWQQIHNPRAQGFGRIIWCGDKTTKTVALTFDDGPNPLATPKILEILEKNKIKATFFIIGKNAVRYPSLVKKISEDDHEIEIHCFSHSPLLFMALPSKINRELAKVKEIVISYKGENPKFFRPPWGNRTPWLLNESKKLDLLPVTWSLDPREAWLWPTPEKVIERVKNQICNGAIILLHDGYGTKADRREVTVKALPQIINILKEQGFSFVLLDELISKD